MNDLAVDNSSTMEADNHEGGPVSSSNGTDASSGQATGTAPGEELFKGIDPNKLAPELKTVYNSMLTDYRGKTAKLSETTKSEIAKATEEYRQKAEYYDQFSKEQKFVDQWNDYVQKANAQGNPDGKGTEGDPVLNQMKQEFSEMKQKMQLAEMSEITSSFADAVDEKGVKIHPEFDELNGIHVGTLQNGKSSESFSLLRACIELSPGKTPQEKLANGYKQAKAARDAIFESGKKAGMGRLQTKILSGTIPPSNNGSDAMTITDKRPKNAREAMAQAKKGILVSRD